MNNIHIIHGERGSGKTHKLIEAIKKDPNDSIVVVVANQRQVHAMSKRLCEAGVDMDKVSIITTQMVLYDKSLVGAANGNLYIDDLEGALSCIWSNVNHVVATSSICVSMEYVEYIPEPFALTVPLPKVKETISMIKQDRKIIISFGGNILDSRAMNQYHDFLSKNEEFFDSYKIWRTNSYQYDATVKDLWNRFHSPIVVIKVYC